MNECTSFHRCIQNFLNRQRKRLENKHGRLPQAYEDHCRTAIALSDHATYLLETLYIKRESLSNAIQSFESTCENSIQVIKSNLESSSLGSILQKILTHLFVQYIRIRDGFVLLTSGECRHHADAEIAKNEKRFPSKLGSLSKRNDGYTTLFSSKLGYSGYGWDEFHNEEVGVRRRLLDSLRMCCRYPTHSASSSSMHSEMEEKFLDGAEASASRDKLWDKLYESGAEAFETAFDRHENEMKNLQRKLETIRSNMTCDVEKLLSYHRESVRIIMVTEDKFERLQLKNAGTLLGLSEFTIQRQGDAFRGLDKRGALPSNADKSEWMKIMELPEEFKKVFDKKRRPLKSSSNDSKSNSITRKRKVILDSDEEMEKETRPEQSFKVTIKKSTNVNEEKIPVSLNQIKQQFGVNVDELERGREDLEAEEEGTKKAAYEDEAREISSFHQKEAAIPPYSEEMFDLIESIKNEEDKIKMYYNVCKRELAGNEAWDVRESLRFSLMTIGNLYLECNSLVPNSDDFHYLRKAQRYFEESIHVIKELKIMNESDKDDEKEFKNRKRALLLCRGRAYTNLGKTHFEQSEIIRKNQSGTLTFRREYMSRLSMSLKCFKIAEQEAEILRTQSIVSDSIDKRAELHMIDAKVMLSLACRFQGNAYLRLSKEKESIDVLKKACGMNENDVNTFSKEKRSEVVEAFVWLLLERYDSACSLIHTCCSILDLAVRATSDESWNNIITDVLIECYDYIAKLSDTMHAFTHDNALVKGVIGQHEVLCSNDILKLKEETAYRLRNRKCLNKSVQMSSKPPSLLDLPRNDLFRNQDKFLSNQPRERVVINDTQHKPPADTVSNRHQKICLTGASFDNFSLDMGDSAEIDSDEILFTNMVRSKCYRKWGDELLAENGLDVFAYPSCEPPRPDEMIRDLKKVN